jgi:hypothetical protein
MRSRCAPSGCPIPGACDRIEPAYGKLVGANLVQGFRKRLHDDMGGVHGCTHVTELLGSLPTAAVQTFAGLRRENDGDAKPFQLDRCHALETTTDTVRRYYPKWYRGLGAARVTTRARPPNAPDAPQRRKAASDPKE